jgi:hypothetical protein
MAEKRRQDKPVQCERRRVMLLTKNEFAAKNEVVMDGRPTESEYDVDEGARQWPVGR